MNFIFFNPDEMRAESAGCYGHSLVKTPNLDKLAADGVRFNQAHVTHTVCSPSRCSVLTGWYPHVRGHRSLYNLLTPDEPNMFKYLSEAGYDILWYGKNDAFSPETFEGIITKVGVGSKGENAGPNRYSFNDSKYYTFLHESPGDYQETKDYDNVQQAIEYISSNPKKPFAIYLPLGNPHPPYCAPQGFHDMYDPDEIPSLRPVCTEGKPDYYDKIRETRRLDELSERDFREINAKYLGQVSYLDSLFGDLIQALEENNLLDDTAIFFWSDHGDWAGDYGLVEKWPAGLDDTLTRIPFVVRAPGAAKNHVIEECIEHHDLMPTVLELAGIDPQHSFFARSLVPQLYGEKGDKERAVFAEGGYDDPIDSWCFEGRENGVNMTLDPKAIYYPKMRLQQTAPHTVCRSTMIRTMTHKLIYRTAQINELYDLANDPLELNNVYNDPAYLEVRQELEKKLLDWYISTSDVTPWRKHPRGHM